MPVRQNLNNILRWVAACLLSLPVAFSSNAQTDEYSTPIPVPQSPNAASFGEYGKISVNGYQGTASLSIPMFEFELCGKKFPVTLSYNSSGIKVAQEASWVGLGWNLNIGGCITRQVNGGDDFYRENQQYPYTEQKLSDLSTNELVNQGYSYSSQYLLTSGWQVPYPNIFGYDTQPDEFYFNFGGHCGAFFFESNTQRSNRWLQPVVVQKEEELHITFDLDHNRFIVRDLDGFFYYFGTLEYTTTGCMRSQGVGGYINKLKAPSSDSYASALNDDYANITAWMLDSIVAPNGEAIRFKYAHEAILTPVQVTEMDQIRLDPTFQSNTPDKHRYMATYSNARIDQQRLIEVSSPTLSVTFSTGPRSDLRSVDPSLAPKACKTINLKESRLLQTYTLYQSYFGDVASYRTCRMRLDSVMIGSRYFDGQQMRGDYQVYRFAYNNGQLPAKNSRQRDLWGYFNNSTAPEAWGGGDSKNEGTVFPSMKVQSQSNYRTIVYGRNKKCQPKYMQYGILTDITYPTGGRTHFEYEPHSFEPLHTAMKEFHLNNSGYASVNYFSKRFDQTIDSIGAHNNKYITITDTSEVLLDISYEMRYQISEPINANLVIQKKDAASGYYSQILYNHSVTTSTVVRTGSDRQTVLLTPGTYNIYWQCVNNIYAPYSNNGQQPYGNMLNFQATISYNTSTQGSDIFSQGGGLRIKEQYDLDVDGNKYNHRKYTYEGGLHYVFPTFEFGPFHIDHLYSNGYSSCLNVSTFIYHGYSSEPLIALTPPFCSSPVGYNKVTEEFIGNGSIESYYQNQRAVFFNDPLLYDTNTQVPGAKCSILNFLGTLKKTRVYDNDNRLASETTYQYNDKQIGSAQAVVAYMTYIPYSQWDNTCPNSHSYSPNIALKKYKVEGYTHLLSLQSVTEYFDGDSITQTTSYTYDDCLRPIEVTTTGSNGSVKTTRTEYLTNTNQLSLVTKQTFLTDGEEDLSKSTDYKYLQGGKFRVPSQTYQTENCTVSNKVVFDEHNALGDPLSIRLEEDQVLKYEWDKHRLVGHTQSGLLHYEFAHHPLFGLTRRTEPSGMVTEYNYNGLGQLASVSANKQTLVTYDYQLRKNGENIVTTQTWLSGEGANRLTSQQYYNGLGYPTRSVAKGFTPNRNDLSTETAYDDRMRPVRTYLPILNNWATYSDSRPFAETAYEAAPTDRAVASWKPGEAYAAHPARVRYQVNGENEVRLLHPTSDGVSCNGYYDKGCLYKQTAVNEDGDSTATFTDLDGNAVLGRSYLDGRPVDTYYVYDNLGRLRCMLPPLAVSALTEGLNRYDAEFMRQYAYVYTYDSHGDLVEKRLPGCEPMHMAYDKAHRMTGCTDGNGQTVETTYDKVGRVVRTSSGGRILTENTYKSTLLSTQRVAVFDSADAWIERTFAYDDRERLVSTRQTNLVGGYDFDSTVYSHASLPLEQWHTHVGHDSISWRYRFVYDHAQRPIQVYYKLGSNDEILLTQNTYNELCQLSGKALYDGLIQQAFAYNLQGACNRLSGTEYEQRLFFEDAPEGAMPSFSGNISAKADSSALGANLQRFSYDGLDRLVEAVSPAHSTRYAFDDMANVTALVRKAGGLTIDSLLLDYEGHQLIAVHDSAHSQHRYATVEYQDREQADRSMFYDANGNLVADYDRNILRIEYNLLNLPSEIVFMDSSRIINTYAADGTKLRSVYKTNTATLLFPIGHLCEQEQVEYATRIVDYCGGVRYEHDGSYHNTVIYNTEGYYSQADSAFFAYQKDYQGNIAQVWQVSDSSGFLSEPKMVQLNEYIPDGTPTPRTIGEEAQPYKYNSNEWVRFNGADMYDFNARMYYPAAPRFGSIDPLAEKYYNLSPYAYCGGNPVKYKDPNGQDCQIVFDYDNQTITITANVFIYGKYATQDNADLIKQNIMQVWGALTQYDSEDASYSLVWDVNVGVMEEGQEKDFNGVNNYMEITDDPSVNRSHVTNTNIGKILFSDLESHVGTAAHEFGHTLGLRDKYDTTRHLFIETPNGTIVTQPPFSEEWSDNIMYTPYGSADYKNLDLLLSPFIKSCNNKTTETIYVNKNNREKKR